MVDWRLCGLREADQEDMLMTQGKEGPLGQNAEKGNCKAND